MTEFALKTLETSERNLSVRLFDTSSGLNRPAENVSQVSALGFAASGVPSQNEEIDLVINYFIIVLPDLVQEQ